MSQALAKQESRKPVVAGLDFSPVRRCLAEFEGAVGRAVAWQILTGMALSELREKHGIAAGGNRRGNAAELPNFESLIRQETGLTKRTAYRYMALADGAKEHLAKVRALTPAKAAKIPADKMTEIISTATGGKSARQLMAEWAAEEDAEEDADENDGPPIHRLGGGDGGKPESGAEAIAAARLETWRGLRSELESEHALGSYADLPTVEIDAWLERLAALKTDLTETLTARKPSRMKGGLK